MNRNRTQKCARYSKSVYWVIVCAFLLTGCSDDHRTEEKINMQNSYVADGQEEPEENQRKIPGEDKENAAEKDRMKMPEETKKDEMEDPQTVEADWSGYFSGLDGAAVVYDASRNRYTIYNSELALTERSPCSTFKIISSLIALENGIVTPEDSTRTWSGEVFWNEDWNKDIDFSEAFRTSCVWYYRQVIDEIGKELIQKELDGLRYGNCDISDWEGRLNTNNQNRALTGFWIESSLMISPKEQTQVMERIFGNHSDYAEETQNELKKVMLITEQERSDISCYGKTGMGKTEGIVVDAWFTGFAERAEGKIYFCVYLGRTDGMNVSSSLAKQIAIQIVSDYETNDDTKEMFEIGG